MNKIGLIAAQIVLVFILYLLGALILGVALYPSILVFMMLYAKTALMHAHLRVLVLCIGAALGYFIFGMALMLIVGSVRTLFCLKLTEGDHTLGSTGMLKWYVVNALFLCVRIAFMEFMLLTPLCSFFYRLMGAHLGLNVQINSKNVADHSLLEIGDNSVIGGNATVIGHSFERNGLRLKKVKIGRNVIVGLNSVIFPGTIIGDGAVVAAGAIVPKNTVIEPGEIFISTSNRIPKK